MASRAPALVLLLLVAVEMTQGAVYKVGDSSGWTTSPSPNYTAWASSKSFHVGDIILFEYNKHFHDVLEVSEADYALCRAESPIATYTTGKDSITITIAGAKFYICGFPGQCGAGQKVDIRASNARSDPGDSPGQSPSSPPPSPSPRSLPPFAKGGGVAPPSSMSDAASVALRWTRALAAAAGALAASGVC